MGGGSILVSRTVVNHHEKRKRFDIFEIIAKKFKNLFSMWKRMLGRCVSMRRHLDKWRDKRGP